jgi:beta-N-acetylhexosaminidase
MKKIILMLFAICIAYAGCGKKESKKYSERKENKTDTVKYIEKEKFKLMDFLSDNPGLMQKTDSIFNSLSDEEKIGQMIVAAAGVNGNPSAEVASLIKKKTVGGILILGGSMQSYEKEISFFRNLAKESGCLPIIFSADAEPSLINLKISGVKQFPKTISIKDKKESEEIAKSICEILKKIGVIQNFAPVCDVGVNAEVIGDRAFSKKPEIVKELASAFIRETQKEGLIATAKHFPGHGYAKGDSHKSLVTIDGELKELDQFKSAIENDSVLSVMLGHIAVNNSKYDTNGYPATLNRKIVTNLLKDEMKFKGLIITDAMNMGALNKFDKPSFNAIKAGVDMVLMPKNESTLIDLVKNEMNKNHEFKKQIEASVKKIIKLKICLNLI